MRTKVGRFTPHEIELVRRSKESEERAAAKATGLLTSAGNLPAKSGRVRTRVAEICGVSRKTVDKVAEIYAAAAAEPERFGDLAAALDAGASIGGVARRLKRMRDEARLLGLAPVEKRFMTLCLDPPWEDESVSESQRPPYATMGLTEIRALPVDQWQLDEGHIYVHAPGPFVAIAISLIEAWGYQYKTLITWKKSRWSMGRYFRTQAEYIAFGVRGGLMTRRGDVANHFEGPVGDHSEKPEAFYDLVRAQSFPPYGEGFQIRPRPDFLNLYPPRAAIAVAAE